MNNVQNNIHVFTTSELNDLVEKVIQKTLEAAAKEAKIKNTRILVEEGDFLEFPTIDRNSILSIPSNQIFKNFQV
jgi:hypothetical protein